MTIIWDFSSQEPVFAIEAEEAGGILGVVLSPGVRLKKKEKAHPGSSLHLAMRSFNYSEFKGMCLTCILFRNRVKKSLFSN